MPSSLVVDIQGAILFEDALALQNAISKAQEERDALDYWIGKGKQQMAVLSPSTPKAPPTQGTPSSSPKRMADSWRFFFFLCLALNF